MIKIVVPWVAVAYDPSINRKGFVRPSGKNQEHVKCGQLSWKKCPYRNGERCLYETKYITLEGSEFSFKENEVLCGL